MIPKYHLTSKRPLWDPSTSLYSSQGDRMVAKLSMDSHSPDMAVSSVTSVSYTHWHHKHWEFCHSLRSPCQGWHDHCSADSLSHYLATGACRWLQHASPALGYLSPWGQEQYNAPLSMVWGTLQIQPWCNNSAPMIACSILSFASHNIHRHHVC